MIWIALGQCLGIFLTENVVYGGPVHDEMGRLVDKRSSLGIGTAVGELPEATADVDDSELIGNWSRDLSVTDLHHGCHERCTHRYKRLILDDD